MKKSIILALHLVYWGGCLLLMLFVYSLLRLGQGGGPNPGHLFLYMALGFFVIPGLLAFYSFYTFLYAKFLNRKKITALFLYGFIVAFACGLVGEILLSVIIGGVGDNKGELIFPNYSPSEITVAFVIIFFISTTNGLIGLIMKGFVISYGDIKLKDDLNKKNYEVELELVKSQINPHFLFNTINNIDVLIEKDASRASAYLNKLSDIMRFMLYETKTEKIALEKELTYIEKYIDLQKIRTSNPAYVNYSAIGDPKNHIIAPMLFIPFIENAFKHTENKKVENAININIIIEKEMITFDCENNYSTETQVKPDQSGLGNELIRKRLALLYPNKHTLEINNKNNTYKVKLILFQK